MHAQSLSHNDRRSIARVRLLAVTFCSFLAVNDLSIYFGVHSESVQAMFSGLLGLDTLNNHLFMPQFHVTRIGDYYYLSSVQVEGVNANTEELQAIQRWMLSKQGTKTLVNDQTIRSITRRLCDHGGTVSLKLRSTAAKQITVENACTDAVFRSENRWIPIRLHLPALDDEVLRSLQQ